MVKTAENLRAGAQLEVGANGPEESRGLEPMVIGQAPWNWKPAF